MKESKAFSVTRGSTSGGRRSLAGNHAPPSHSGLGLVACSGKDRLSRVTESVAPQKALESCQFLFVRDEV